MLCDAKHFESKRLLFIHNLWFVGFAICPYLCLRNFPSNLHTLLKYFTRNRLIALLFVCFALLWCYFCILCCPVFFYIFYFALFNFHLTVIDCEVNIKGHEWKVTRAIVSEYFFSFNVLSEQEHFRILDHHVWDVIGECSALCAGRL